MRVGERVREGWVKRERGGNERVDRGMLSSTMMETSDRPSS